MIRIVCMLLIFSLMAGGAISQDITLTGRFTDKDTKVGIGGATITLTSVKPPVSVKNVVTDSKGNFLFNGLTTDMYVLTTSYSGYEKISQKINLQASNKVPLVFSVGKLSTTLGEVIVTAKAPPVKVKGDTTEFSASQFKVNPDATAEDMIKKLPGITIDKSGNVTALGEQVKKVTVDGRDYFGDDATAALRNLPAEVIDKIQVFDKLSDQAAFTGFDDGNSTKSINIVTKANMRNGQFGRVYAGYGTDGRYLAGGNMSFFKGNQRVSLVGLFNNVNQQNFSSQDLLGVTSSGGGRNGGNRGGRGQGGNGNQGGGNLGGGNNGSNFLVGQQNGISATNAFGVNFSDKWGKKLDVTGSYFFNNSNTNNNQLANTQYFLTKDSSQFNTDNSISSSKNYNHRINLRFNYQIDSSNSLMIVPSISFQKNQSYNNSMQTNRLVSGINGPVQIPGDSSISNTSLSSNTSGYNINNNILFRHSFAKRGRTFSVNVGTAVTEKTGENYQQSINKYYKTLSTTQDSLQQLTDQTTNGYQLSANLAYTEPVGKKGQLQFNYSPSYSKNKADQNVNQYDYSLSKYSKFDTSLSNKFDNTVTTQNGGVTYRVGDRDNQFSAGASFQHTQLNSDQTFPLNATVNKSFNNFLPNLMWRKKLSAKSNIRVFYRASTNTPSINQLQNVYNNFNPLSITTGNPDLKQQTGNLLSSRYSYTNSAKSTSFFANLFLQQNSNYIGTAYYIARRDSVLTNTVTLHQGSQLTKPVNLDGYLSLRSFFTYGFPIKAIKSNLNVNAGLTWSKVPGLINNVSSLSNNYNYNTGIVIASNISEYIDFNVSYSANFNVVNPQTSNNYVSQNAGLQANLLSKKGWFLQNDISNQTYSGLSSGFNQSYWLWNAAVGKKFLKGQNGELKLSVFDLLKQNRSIVRTVDPNYIEDVQNQVLTQYFMLTFSYKLRNFGTPAARKMNNQENERNRPGNGFPSF